MIERVRAYVEMATAVAILAGAAALVTWSPALVRAAILAWWG